VTLAQLILDLPHRAALGAEDFLVSDCNLAAVRLIDAWPNWQDHVQLLIGPPASGKTHLARVWQALSGAEGLEPERLAMDFVDSMSAGTPLVVEDADRLAYDEDPVPPLEPGAGEAALCAPHGPHRPKPMARLAAGPVVAAERGPRRRDRAPRRSAHSDRDA
jgi:hypothetical protein